MKKVFFAFALMGAALFGGNTASAQVEEGDFLIDPYIGVPTGNVWWQTLTSEENFETRGLPISYGGRFEYMVADNFGLGVDVNYVVTGYEYTWVDYNYDATTGLYSDAQYGYTAKKLRAMLRFNYHFVQTDMVDVYLGIGGGYKSAKRTFDIDGIDDASITIPTLLPIAFRVAVGGRIYFTDNIGANFEFGAGGGGIMQLGLALKF